MARAEEAEQAGDFELPPEQWRAWEVFTACERNWRVLIGPFASDTERAHAASTIRDAIGSDVVNAAP